MTNLPFPSWVEQSNLFNLPYTDIEACSETSPAVSVPPLPAQKSSKAHCNPNPMCRTARYHSCRETTPIKWAQGRWPYPGWLKEPSQHSHRQADFIVGMSVAHASLVGRGRPNARVTSLDVGIVGRLGLYAAILMENERNPKGKSAQLQSVSTRLTHPSTRKKRQLASLSAKVQAYEDVIRKLSSRFGVSDEQLMGIALNVVWQRTFLLSSSILSF